MRDLRIENEPIIEAFRGIQLLSFFGFFFFFGGEGAFIVYYRQISFPDIRFFTFPTIIAYKSENSI